MRKTGNKNIILGYNDFATVMPSIAKEWHPTKNGDLTPQDVTVGSNKKVWWLCEKGHEWKTSVVHRSNGNRCPKCFGESKTSFPEQAIFFYFRQVTTAYNRYIIEPKLEIDIYLPEYRVGIEYDGAYFHKGDAARQREKRKQEKLNLLGIRLVRVREIEDQACDYTIYAKSGANDNELTKAIKELVSLVSHITKTSFNIDVNVRRDRNKIYEQYVLSEKENSLAVANPKLASDWHPSKNRGMLPEYVSANSNKKVWWICEKGHEWEATVSSRSRGAGCPYCAGLCAIVGINDLTTVDPKLAAQWHPTKNGNLQPQDVMANSNKKVWWLCENGHEWETQISARSSGRNCPICSGHKVLIGYNDVATKNPELSSEWHPTKNGDLTPQMFTVGSKQKVWWLCQMGHEWEAAIHSRNNGRGCPYCANQVVLKGQNDLETKNPKLAAQWHPTKNNGRLPSDFAPTSNKKVWWICEKDHEWEAVIASRTSGRGCPYCASQKLLVGYNDLYTCNPKLASEWHPTKNGELTPKDIMPGSNKKVWWLCEKGHEWEISVNTRNRGNGCPYCANQKLLVGYNDLYTCNPKLASEWHPTQNGELTPKDVMPGCNKKAWWICEKGHEWEAVIISRSKGAGCWECYGLRRKNKAQK